MLRSNNELARHAQIAEQDNLLMKVPIPCYIMCMRYDSGDIASIATQCISSRPR
jgi:hypothetical protein